MKKMTKRERVEATMNFADTDRVPVYDLLCSDAAIEHFSGRRAPPGEEGVRLRCQAIGRMLDMTRDADGAPPEQLADTTDEDGFVFHANDRYISGGIARRPFSDEKGAKAWLGRVLERMRKRNREFDYQKHAVESRARFLTLQQYLGDDTVMLRTNSGTGLDTVRYALGLELFAYVEADEPDLVSAYLELATQHEIEIAHAIADPALSPCALTYGDIACKGRLLHSPAYLRREFYPRLKRVNDAWHAHGVKCLFHSDGDIMEALPDLIAAGIDGLNPIETVAGMDLAEIRKRYGRKLFLTGGIDISQLMAFGTPDQVRRVCQEAISTACPGYFIGSTTELDNGARLENILVMLETAWTSGPVRGGKTLSPSNGKTARPRRAGSRMPRENSRT